MTHDPIRVADTQAWLRRANRDLRAAAHDLKAEPSLHDAVVFHCQQAVEKTRTR
ncbi:MAG: HEPN domain-containing protein [Planctomycetes bacterium]|nr:HEPN domain-containing protein [Planctomycetota bacterium]